MGVVYFPVAIFVVFFSADEIKFREDLMNIARTTLSSKILVHHRDHFASLAVDAVLRLKVRFVVGVAIVGVARLLKIIFVGGLTKM